MISSALLAVDAPLPADELSSLLFFAKLLGGLITLIGMIYMCVSIWSMLRRQPPSDEVYATKNELLQAMTALRGEFLRAEENRKEGLEQFRNDLKVESLRAELLKFEVDRKDATHGLHSKIENMNSSVDLALRDVSGQIGKLEGKNESLQFIIDTIKANHRPEAR